LKEPARLEISAIECYCDQLKDLFSDSAVELQVDANKKLQLKNQSWSEIKSSADFLQGVKLSSGKRVFGTNGINNHSSRSHHIFQVRLTSRDKLGKPKVNLLNIIDLAGSERRQD
jgi:hypothetical protein